MKKITTVLLWLASTTACVAFLSMLHYVGRASADSGGGLDPSNPVGALGQLYDFIRTGKGTAALGVALILVVWLLRNLPIQRWKDLVQTPTGGYILVYGTALLTYVGTGLASGNPFTAMMLLNAAGAALVASGGWEHLRDILTALMQKKVPPSVTGATGAVVLLLAFGMLSAPLWATLSAGCQGVKDAGQAVVDCTKENAGSLESEGLALAAMIPDWKSILAKAEADALKIGEQIAGCALAEVVQKYTSSADASKNVGASWGAHDALESYRTKHAGGATYHTASGDL